MSESYLISYQEPVVSSQEAKGRRQKAGGKRQEAKGRRQKAGGKRQEAKGRRQKAKGKRQLCSSHTPLPTPQIILK
ncbi:MAG: hypothetical protein O9275_17475, partial [Microcystis sp. LE19-196.1B]|nr:hypothetical protein [Microcystis sp. LE19-196.1B]